MILPLYFNHPDQKINQGTDDRSEDYQEQPQNFFRGIALARGALVDHPNPEKETDDFPSLGALEEVRQSKACHGGLVKAKVLPF
jgi:hypothetical protein